MKHIIVKKIKSILQPNDEKKLFKAYMKKYFQYTFIVDDCKSYEQYEASITRVYHTIEKGLSYENYRAGFGQKNIETLLKLMESYAKDYDTSAFFYRTSLSTLHAYLKKNADHGHADAALEKRVNALPGEPNDYGGIIEFAPPTPENLKTKCYEELVCERHSMRDFSEEEVPDDLIAEAIKLAQFTPSACNRQGWRTRIVSTKATVQKVLANQNGNKGFSEKINKVLVITADLRYFNRDREVHQVFIDGGMYAMRVLDALYYKGIAAIPLSASLQTDQDRNIREILDVHDAEELILIVGIGNYPAHCQTTRSERKEAEILIY